ncbi:MAG: AbrB/MazE/SpoVT family DNA-binding domain-containing protein [Candidatus Omnitrophica bacterium]|nr:AbrB/MazE/SpoVT family DNA-binding domain-containing protein [Candidatus Omnitrophota bacterium]MCA9440535.1 AbrB/MazE/SpoVT family DNA-binding domain-containing protein [Candidatus Omnitrophota bacterium]
MEAKAKDTITLLTKEKGHTLAIPDEMLADLSIEDGDTVEARIVEGRLVLSPVPKVKGGLRYTESGLKKEREAEEDIRAGRVKSFDSVEDLLKDLNDED